MTSELEPSKKGKSRKTTDGDGASSSSGKPASDNGTSHGATTNGKSPNPPSVNGDTDMQGFGNSNATAPSASQNGGLVNGAAGEESRVVSFNHLDNSEVVCPHGGLIPALVGTVKCITQVRCPWLSQAYRGIALSLDIQSPHADRRMHAKLPGRRDDTCLDYKGLFVQGLCLEGVRR